MRSVIGWKPVNDPRADELRNKNLNAEEGHVPMYTDNSGKEGVIPETIGPIDTYGVGDMKLSELLNY